MPRESLMQISTRLVAAAVCAALAGCAKEAPPAPPPPTEVKVSTVLQRDVPIYVEAIGETRGSTEIEIRARVEGFLESVEFQEGSYVTKGQLLYIIDPGPIESTLAQARADQAQAEANLARTHQDVVRFEPLVAKNAISRQEYETAVVQERAAQAALEAAKATVKRAELDITYTHIVAPEPGLIGKTEVYPGTLVGRMQNSLLTRISQIDVIHVRVNIPEREYLYYVRRYGVQGQAHESMPKEPLELVLADGSVHPHGGRVVFTDRNVDARTGTMLIEAAFPNPERILRPGQFVRMRAPVDLKKGAILVPQRALWELQGIDNVAVVGSDATVEFRPVTTSNRIGSLMVVDSGLKAGESIIVEGIQKVRPGMKVQPQVVPIEETPAPEPAGSAAASK
jgi:membrane fusion protein (multidrug efflux system)